MPEWLRPLVRTPVFYVGDEDGPPTTLAELCGWPARRTLADDEDDDDEPTPRVELGDVPLHIRSADRVFITLENFLDADGLLPWAAAWLDEHGLGAAHVERVSEAAGRVWGVLPDDFDIIEGTYEPPDGVAIVRRNATHISATVARAGTVDASAYAAVDALARAAGVRRPL